MKSIQLPNNPSRTLAQKVATSVFLVLAASQAHGALTVATQIDINGAAPSTLQPLKGDLLETSVTLATGENTSASVRNGTFTDVSNIDNPPSFPAQVWGSAITTYDLNIVTNRFGYDITAVQVYSAWADTRAGQNYQISYALVSAPAVFLALGGNVLVNESFASVITRTADSNLGTSLISGVSSIRFEQAANGVPGDGSVYRELDVEGFATIPEPTTSVLGLCGSLLLFRRRRA